MKRKPRDPNDPDVQAAVLQRFREMTREDWLKSIEELSHAPDGVEDPWRPYAAAGSDGARPSSSPEGPVSPEPNRRFA